MEPTLDLIHDAQDAEKVVQDVEQGVKAIKEGYRTSEFWIMVASQLAIWLNVSNSTSHVQMVNASVSGLIAIAYAAFRTYLKSKV